MTHAAGDAVREIAATPRLLVALDFDGTLAPLGDDPMAVRADPAARRAVARLAALPDTTVAFVSGRQIADLRVIAEHDDGSPVWLAGSHGAEWWQPGGAAMSGEDAQPDAEGAAEADRLIERAREVVDGIDGAWIESKAFGFALHTRLADPAAAKAAQREVDALVRDRAPTWRRRTGRDVREYAWRHEGKDQAVERLRELTGATAVLFAGDDVTDEDAQRSLGPGDLGVRVGDGETVAQLRVSGPAELAALLDEIAGLRSS